MKKEYVLTFITGLFILAYVLDSVVNPLKLKLTSPYHYFITPNIMTIYVFTTASIFIKALGLFLTPLLALSFLEFNRLVSGLALLILAGLAQLYALQDVATNSQALPLEWSVSLTVAGAALLVPAVVNILLGLLKQAHQKLVGPDEISEETIDEIKRASSQDDKTGFWEKK